jgi:hypothetical protein
MMSKWAQAVAKTQKLEARHWLAYFLRRPGADEFDRRHCTNYCARSESGHATAAPPTGLMNGRRFG